MEKENKNFMEKNKKQVIAIALALVLLIGGSYAWLSVTLKGTKKVRIEAGTLSLVLDEGNAINVSDSVPMSDADGLATDAYTFSLQNNGNVTSEYRQIVRIYNYKSELIFNIGYNGSADYSSETLFNSYTFADGTPFGIKEE